MRRLRFGSLRLMLAPLLRRKSRASVSIAALTLGACTVTALLTLYRGVQANLSHEFRRYGANLVVTPAREGERLPRAASDAALAPVNGVGLLYTEAEANGQPAIVSGADLVRLRRLNPSWRIRGTTPVEGEAWAGVNAARALELTPGSAIAVAYGGQTATWKLSGTVNTGGSEDNQIFAPIAAVESLTGLGGYTTLQARVGADAASMSAAVRQFEQALPGAQASPVRQIAMGEGQVLLSAKSMMITSIALILLTVGLCLGAALTTLALERRRDFGLMKALGGDESTVLLAFVGEAGMLGVLSAIAGLGLGAAIAAGMGHALFGLWMAPDISIAGWVLAVTVGLAAVSAWLPWPIIRGVTPAAILRGD